MKVLNCFLTSLLVIFFINSVSTIFVFAQDQKKAEEEEQKKMIETWKKYSFPSEKHKHLEYFVGHWESVQKVFSQPGDEPTVLNQEIHVESLFDGRFTKAHIKAKKKSMGTYSESIVITGYDNYKQEVISISFSNKATDFKILTGTLDETGKKRIDTGVRTDIFTGREYKVKSVTTIINRDKYIYEVYLSESDQEEYKAMEITYTRKK